MHLLFHFLHLIKWEEAFDDKEAICFVLEKIQLLWNIRLRMHTKNYYPKNLPFQLEPKKVPDNPPFLLSSIQIPREKLGSNRTKSIEDGGVGSQNEVANVTALVFIVSTRFPLKMKNWNKNSPDSGLFLDNFMPLWKIYVDCVQCISTPHRHSLNLLVRAQSLWRLVLAGCISKFIENAFSGLSEFYVREKALTCSSCRSS